MDNGSQLTDDLRPQVFNQVLGPISHYCMVLSLPILRSGVDDVKKNGEALAISFKRMFETKARTAAEAIALLTGSLQTIHYKIDLDRVTDLTKFPLTKKQVDAINLFLSNSKSRHLWKFCGNPETDRFEIWQENAITAENEVFLGLLPFITSRIEGFEPQSLDDFIKLISHPDFPDVLRAVMSGGRSFDSYLQGAQYRYSDIFDDFVSNKRPLAFYDGKRIVVNPEVIELARLQRKEMKERSDDPVYAEYELVAELDNLPFRPFHSSGCPAKGLTFFQSTPLLDAHGLGLTDEQIQILCSGENPVAAVRLTNKPEGRTIFDIRRDSVREIIKHNTELLQELVQEVLPILLATGNETLRSNVDLLGVSNSIVPTPVGSCPIGR